MRYDCGSLAHRRSGSNSKQPAISLHRTRGQPPTPHTAAPQQLERINRQQLETNATQQETHISYTIGDSARLSSGLGHSRDRIDQQQTNATRQETKSQIHASRGPLDLGFQCDFRAGIAELASRPQNAHPHVHERNTRTETRARARSHIYARACPTIAGKPAHTRGRAHTRAYTHYHPVYHLLGTEVNMVC